MKKPKQVKNLLELVPERSRSSEQREDGTTDVLIPRYGGGIMGRLLSAILKNTPFRLHLDKIGTRTWELCDGRRTVQEIGQHLGREFGSEVEPVYDRLGVFFKQLESQELISWKSETLSHIAPMEN
jgi:hypothetical protein